MIEASGWGMLLCLVGASALAPLAPATPCRYSPISTCRAPPPIAQTPDDYQDEARYKQGVGGASLIGFGTSAYASTFIPESELQPIVDGASKGLRAGVESAGDGLRTGASNAGEALGAAANIAGEGLRTGLNDAGEGLRVGLNGARDGLSQGFSAGLGTTGEGLQAVGATLKETIHKLELREQLSKLELPKELPTIPKELSRHLPNVDLSKVELPKVDLVAKVQLSDVQNLQKDFQDFHLPRVPDLQSIQRDFQKMESELLRMVRPKEAPKKAADEPSAFTSAPAPLEQPLPNIATIKSPTPEVMEPPMVTEMPKAEVPDITMADVPDMARAEMQEVPEVPEVPGVPEMPEVPGVPEVPEVLEVPEVENDLLKPFKPNLVPPPEVTKVPLKLPEEYNLYDKSLRDICSELEKRTETMPRQLPVDMPQLDLPNLEAQSLQGSPSQLPDLRSLLLPQPASAADYGTPFSDGIARPPLPAPSLELAMQTPHPLDHASLLISKTNAGDDVVSKAFEFAFGPGAIKGGTQALDWLVDMCTHHPTQVGASLAAGAAGATALNMASQSDSMLGVALRKIGRPVDLLSGISFQLTFELIRSAIGAVIGACLGAILGVSEGPRGTLDNARPILSGRVDRLKYEALRLKEEIDKRNQGYPLTPGYYPFGFINPNGLSCYARENGWPGFGGDGQHNGGYGGGKTRRTLDGGQGQRPGFGGLRGQDRRSGKGQRNLRSGFGGLGQDQRDGPRNQKPGFLGFGQQNQRNGEQNQRPEFAGLGNNNRRDGNRQGGGFGSRGQQNWPGGLKYPFGGENKSFAGQKKSFGGFGGLGKQNQQPGGVPQRSTAPGEGAVKPTGYCNPIQRPWTAPMDAARQPSPGVRLVSGGPNSAAGRPLPDRPDAGGRGVPCGPHSGGRGVLGGQNSDGRGVLGGPNSADRALPSRPKGASVQDGPNADGRPLPGGPNAGGRPLPGGPNAGSRGVPTGPNSGDRCVPGGANTGGKGVPGGPNSAGQVLLGRPNGASVPCGPNAGGRPLPGGPNAGGRLLPSGPNAGGRPLPGGPNSGGRGVPGGPNSGGRGVPGGPNSVGRGVPGGLNGVGRGVPGGPNSVGRGVPGGPNAGDRPLPGGPGSGAISLPSSPPSARPVPGSPAGAGPLPGAPAGARPVLGAPARARPIPGAPGGARPVPGAPAGARPVPGAPAGAPRSMPTQSSGRGGFNQMSRRSSSDQQSSGSNGFNQMSRGPNSNQLSSGSGGIKQMSRGPNSNQQSSGAHGAGWESSIEDDDPNAWYKKPAQQMKSWKKGTPLKPFWEDESMQNGMQDGGHGFPSVQPSPSPPPGGGVGRPSVPGARPLSGARGAPGAPGARPLSGAPGAPETRPLSGAPGAPSARPFSGAPGAPSARPFSGAPGAPETRPLSDGPGAPSARPLSGSPGVPGARLLSGAPGAPKAPGARPRPGSMPTSSNGGPTSLGVRPVPGGPKSLGVRPVPGGPTSLGVRPVPGGPSSGAPGRVGMQMPNAPDVTGVPGIRPLLMPMSSRPGSRPLPGGPGVNSPSSNSVRPPTMPMSSLTPSIAPTNLAGSGARPPKRSMPSGSQSGTGARPPSMPMPSSYQSGPGPTRPNSRAMQQPYESSSSYAPGASYGNARGSNSYGTGNQLSSGQGPQAYGTSYGGEYDRNSPVNLRGRAPMSSWQLAESERPLDPRKQPVPTGYESDFTAPENRPYPNQPNGPRTWGEVGLPPSPNTYRGLGDDMQHSSRNSQYTPAFASPRSNQNNHLRPAAWGEGAQQFPIPWGQGARNGQVVPSSNNNQQFGGHTQQFGGDDQQFGSGQNLQFGSGHNQRSNANSQQWGQVGLPPTDDARSPMSPRWGQDGGSTSRSSQYSPAFSDSRSGQSSALRPAAPGEGAIAFPKSAFSDSQSGQPSTLRPGGNNQQFSGGQNQRSNANSQQWGQVGLPPTDDARSPMSPRWGQDGGSTSRPSQYSPAFSDLRSGQSSALRPAAPGEGAIAFPKTWGGVDPNPYGPTDRARPYLPTDQQSMPMMHNYQVTDLYYPNAPQQGIYPLFASSANGIRQFPTPPSAANPVKGPGAAPSNSYQPSSVGRPNSLPTSTNYYAASGNGARQYGSSSPGPTAQCGPNARPMPPLPHYAASRNGARQFPSSPSSANPVKRPGNAQSDYYRPYSGPNAQSNYYQPNSGPNSGPGAQSNYYQPNSGPNSRPGAQSYYQPNSGLNSRPGAQSNYYQPNSGPNTGPGTQFSCNQPDSGPGARGDPRSMPPSSNNAGNKNGARKFPAPLSSANRVNMPTSSTYQPPPLPDAPPFPKPPSANPVKVPGGPPSGPYQQSRSGSQQLPGGPHGGPGGPPQYNNGRYDNGRYNDRSDSRGQGSRPPLGGPPLLDGSSNRDNSRSRLPGPSNDNSHSRLPRPSNDNSRGSRSLPGDPSARRDRSYQRSMPMRGATGTPIQDSVTEWAGGAKDIFDRSVRSIFNK